MALGYVFVGIADSKQQDSYFTVGKSQVEDGRAIYNAMCAQCHEDVTVGAPDMASMSEMSARAVGASLETGKMREQGAGLNDAGKRAVGRALCYDCWVMFTDFKIIYFVNIGIILEVLQADRNFFRGVVYFGNFYF